MKYVKILGLAAVAAMAMMAFASGASAASLYTTEPVGTVKTLPAGTTITSSLTGGTAKLEDTKGNVLDTCTGGGVTGKTTNGGGEGISVKGSVAKEGVTWTGCTVPTSTTEGGELEIAHITGTTSGTVTGKAFKVSINTILFGTCVYTLGAGTHLGTLAGSESGTASLVIKAVVTKVSGICESTGIWNATYTVTKPDPLWVEAK